MNVKYIKWLQIDLTHGYFHDGIASGLELIPFQSTDSSFRNYDIRLRQKKGGVELYVGVNADEEVDLKSALEGLGKVHFELKSTDNLFFNYTDLEFIKEPTILYLNNAPNNGQLLHSDTSVTSNELIKSLPKMFSVPLSDENTSVKIENEQGEAVLEEIDIPDEQTSVLAHLTSWPDGKYVLFVDDTLRENLFLRDQAFDIQTIGVIEIDVETVLSELPNLVSYTAFFKNRSVFLKYQVVVPESRNIEVQSMEVTTPDGSSYAGPVEETLMSQKVSAFTSPAAVPLQKITEQFATLKVDYIEEHSQQTKQEELKLPGASAETINVYQSGEHASAYFSTNIIYV